MKILFDDRWLGENGIGRFAKEMSKRLHGLIPLPEGPRKLHPLDSLWLAKTINKQNPDIYFSPGFNPPINCNPPFIFTLYDLILLKFPGETDFLKKLYFSFVVRPAIRNAAKVLTVSEFSRREIMQWAGVDEKKVISVGCGVSKQFSADGPSWTPGFSYLLYVGNHSPHKNLERMLHAFAKSGLATDLKVVISGAQSLTLKSIIQDLGLTSSVIFSGYIPEHELPEYYRGATALILPSLYEGFGLPVIEAMACGTPVIASDVTSIPEVAGGAALLVDPSNVDGMAKAMQRVFSERQFSLNLVCKGLENAKRYSWWRTAQMVNDILDEVVESRGQ